MLAGFGWYLTAWVLVSVAIGANRVVQPSGGFIGGDLLASGVGENPAVVPMVLALAVVLLSVLVGLGHGWALTPLVGVGVVAVLGLALTGSWLTLVVMAATVLGAAPVLVPRVQDYLWADRLGRAGTDAGRVC
ncbi:hypothetical protein NODU109028_14525 [Nocardioides dubius]|uniref:Integral membrane protein n=2 Tax=Nocardioides dubius TaxID=317019 RepID=A0ABP4EHN0_9ACTN